LFCFLRKAINWDIETNSFPTLYAPDSFRVQMIKSAQGLLSKPWSKMFFVKRVTVEAFYQLMNFLGAETVFNHADYRLMSKRALEGLAQFHEVNLFLRGIVPMIGYRTGTVEYERGERFAVKNKYPLKKMLSFALEGITSPSTRPIRYITILGFLVFLANTLMLAYSVIRWVAGDTNSWLG